MACVDAAIAAQQALAGPAAGDLTASSSSIESLFSIICVEQCCYKPFAKWTGPGAFPLPIGVATQGLGQIC